MTFTEGFVGEGTGSVYCSWSTVCLVFLLVLRIPVCGCFILPFDVAGLGARYLHTRSTFINGTPSSWPLLIALSSVCTGGQKNN